MPPEAPPAEYGDHPAVAASVRIDIWSDIVCPWCYLGARRLDAAVTQLGWDDEVEIVWRAYQLDPSAPNEPGDLRRAIERKYGPGSFDSMTDRLTSLAPEVGIEYRFDRALRVNTLDAHRLMAWALTHGSAAQSALGDRLFRAYFTDGENVADHAALRRCAADAGLDDTEAGEVLAAGTFAEQVQQDLQAAAERGITAVPTFVVADRLAIPGAQDVDTMVSLLTRARERLATDA
jgi:predicted DsbA family dithiol-disulfide isomerase